MFTSSSEAPLGALVINSVVFDKKNSASCSSIFPIKTTDTGAENEGPHYKIIGWSVVGWIRYSTVLLFLFMKKTIMHMQID